MLEHFYTENEIKLIDAIGEYIEETKLPKSIKDILNERKDDKSYLDSLFNEHNKNYPGSKSFALYTEFIKYTENNTQQIITSILSKI